MERKVIITDLHAGPAQAAADLRYWLAQPVQARIDALEAIRAQYLQGRPDADQRLQRVCTVTQLKPG